MRSCLFGFIFLGIWWLAGAHAQAMITIRVSVKVILDANGNWPLGNAAQGFSFDPYNYDSTDHIREVFRQYNERLDATGWGFRFNLTEVVPLSGLSQWFQSDFRDKDVRNQVELEAKLHPMEYAYRLDQNNIYINNSSSGMTGNHLPLLGDVTTMGATGYWSLAMHELGHAFGLCHTFDCNCNACGGSDGCVLPGDDQIADTLDDSPCYQTQTDIAVGNFSRIYSLLTPDQQLMVDNVYFNTMSYHATHNDRFTHDQWEVIVDNANYNKVNTVSGRSYFVDLNNPCGLPKDVSDMMSQWHLQTSNLPLNPFEYGIRNTTPQQFCIDLPLAGFPLPPGLQPLHFCSGLFCLGGPYKTVAEAIQRAASGDRLQIKAGRYNEYLRIDKPLTLATDRGLVSIGRP